MTSLRGADGPVPGGTSGATAIGTIGEQTRLGAERLRKQGQPEAAERVLAEFLERQGDAAPSHLLAHIQNDLGTLNQEQHRISRAYRHYEQAKIAWERSGRNFSLHAATTLNNLATLQWEDGRLAEAHRTFARSADLIAQVAGPSSPALIQLHYNLGNVRMTLNRYAEAEESYRRFLAIANPQSDSNHILKTILVINDLGLLAQKFDRSAETGSRFEQSRRSWAEFREALPVSGERHQGLDQSLLLNLAQSFWKSNSLTEAAEVSELLLALVESRTGGGQPRLSHVLSLRSMILRRLNRKTEAKAAERRARQALDAEGQPEVSRIDLGALQAGFQRR
jgi:tetratricopeptide (TPR) repeat protein